MRPTDKEVFAESAKQDQEGERLMKGYSRLLLLTLFAITLVCATIAIGNHAVMAAQTTTAQAAGDPSSEEEAGYTEEEYAAWEAADKEPDPVKSGTMLIEFLKKYPETKLMTYAEYSYKRVLSQCNEGKKYQELETLAEQWNKLKPGNKTTLALMATAYDKLGHEEKCIQCMEEIYKMEPQAELAYQIALRYKEKLKNESKYLQWAGIVLKASDYDADFGLRFDLMQLYTKNNDMPKAVEFAKATLKSIELVKNPADDVIKKIPLVRHQAYHVLGVNFYEQKKYDEAIVAFQNALKAEKYADGYYWIGMCQWAQDKVDDAIIMFAKAELEKGDIAPKAKEKVETIFKGRHNGNTTGIDKVYRKAKEMPDNF
jgi:tetratricopeptide (TPR) repeat protein